MHRCRSGLTIIWLVSVIVPAAIAAVVLGKQIFFADRHCSEVCASNNRQFSSLFGRCNYMHADTHTNKPDEVRHLFSYTSCSHPLSTSWSSFFYRRLRNEEFSGINPESVLHPASQLHGQRQTQRRGMTRGSRVEENSARPISQEGGTAGHELPNWP